MCGIFATIRVRKAAELTAVGLHAIQHRARDFAGIASTDGANVYREHGPGIVRQAFTKEKLDRLHGLVALGHIRYPTVKDDPDRDNVQPVMGIYDSKPIAVVHNGNLTNVDELRKILGDPLRLATSLDTELIVRLLERQCSGSLVKDLASVLRLLRGSFALVAMTPDMAIAARDPQGNRPLSIGTHAAGGWFISSETCAFPNVGARFDCDIKPGTMALFDGYGVRSMGFSNPNERRCPFEYIYFWHPASAVFGVSVTKIRLAIGTILANLYPISNATIVSPIPDSSNYMAMGYANAAGIPYLPVIHRNHYVGRTFIAATQSDRDVEVERKFVFDADMIAGARIVLVDDSIVRGTTAPRVINRLRTLGAREVHMVVGSPRIKGSCRYGINTPSTEELMASHCDLEDMRRKIDADSLNFLPLENLHKLVGEPQKHCFACMDGKYW